MLRNGCALDAGVRAVAETVANSASENTRAADRIGGMIQPIGAVTGERGGVGFGLRSFTAQH